ncbi:hypothetical protein ACSC95_11820 [Burkholderia vietnamiensis]
MLKFALIAAPLLRMTGEVPMHTILIWRTEFIRLKSRALPVRDWHPFVALAVLYVIASAIAPACGI